ncbi:MAG: cytochrome c biogenesis protein CcdA [Candidatus Kapabacteria bacterium]|jgi:thiol:disulfide interchange protein DsbD|nr:cytochrome c biogenesis protein CcdA [Candidatus Kapabacteria bacterium]
MIRKFILSSFIILFLFGATLHSNEDKHISVNAESSSESVKAGEEFYIKIIFNLDDYWYTYGFVQIQSPEGIGPTPTEISIRQKDNFEVINKAFVTKPKVKYDEGFLMDIEVYEKGEIFIPVRAKTDINFSSGNIEAVLYLQLCDTVRCLPGEEFVAAITPGSFVVSESELSDLLELSISYSEAGYPVAVYASNSVTAETESTVSDNGKQTVQKTESTELMDKKKEEGIFSFLWFSMLMGAVSLLTPCVFPMIPITVSFFTKRAEKTKGKGLRDSLVYSLGIISTFTAIGILVAAVFGPTGISNLATNGWVNLCIASVFVIFALNLFGAFEIQLPTGLMNKLNSKSQGDGIGSVLIMGLVFSLTSFTCTVPFVGSSLISVSSGEWFYPILGMLGFSTVFALPFFLLALFPSFMTALPKAGGWMNNVKVVMGFIEIAAAIKFFSNADLYWAFEIITRDLFISIWIAVTTLVTLYVVGIFRLPHDSPVNGVNATRIIVALIFASMSVWFFTGLLGKPLGELDAFMPPKEYGVPAAAIVGTAVGGAGQNSELTTWYKDYDSALEVAKKLNKPLFVDFTGWQCTNCRWMEMNMFTRAEVSTLLNSMVKVKLYTDSRKESELANRKMQQDRYGSIDLPLYVILDNEEKMIATKAFTRDEQEFIDFLKKGDF